MNTAQTIATAQQLQSTGARVVVITFDVTSSVALSELSNIASDSALLISVNSLAGMDEQIDSSISITCEGAQRTGRLIV